MPFYLDALVIHLILILVDYSNKKLRKSITSLFTTTLISSCLIVLCSLIDKLLPYLDISWTWHVATLFTLLIIFEEMLWIVSHAGKYVNVGFLKQTINSLLQLVQQKSEK